MNGLSASEFAAACVDVWTDAEIDLPTTREQALAMVRDDLATLEEDGMPEDWSARAADAVLSIATKRAESTADMWDRIARESDS